MFKLPRFFAKNTSPFRMGQEASYWKGKTLLHFRNRNGAIDHYYHFLFGMLLPLVHYLDHHQGEVLVRDTGPMTRLLFDYNDPRVHVLPYDLHQQLRKSGQVRRMSLDGYDHRDFYDREIFRAVRNTVWRKMACYQSFFEDKYPGLTGAPYALLISRAATHPWYKNKRPGQGEPDSGRERRHLANFKELPDALRKHYPVLAVELEFLPFWEQILLFRHAHAVIGQHGAGLGNLIWAERCRVMIEVSGVKREQKRNFRALAELLDILWEEIPTGTSFPVVPPGLLLAHLGLHWNGEKTPPA